MEKKQQRVRVLQQLNNLSYSDYRNRSLRIAKKLLDEQIIQDATTIAITIGNRPEVDTTAIIEQLWQLGKQVVVPKCEPVDHTMEFYEIDSFIQTERAFKDILEPIPACTELVKKNEIDVIIVPGVVFGTDGYRIGFGGGYYDRYLPAFQGKLISLAFEEQLMDNIPREPHDIPVHILITDKRRMNCQ
ncbi:5-formyltetrahydrofolate cyclo-ligase [Solibacillus sp. R5-41]|uniref:5-formyltetrahydrofolate cyclo-ligase n=1 Tax=Solibacillus sp. R5-41 TaxID=2048654 RepID=UPI000C125619|nr:5-formyltetrahydrofolate cyclo-ligase [Solibacillus sp. R5-41]ATP41061.1 5-formyltetrahydrofolate cyclo-ligase [Solibacillus sp. R5-41]